MGKEEVKLSLFADDMILYLKDPENSTKNILGIINTFSKVAGYKNQFTKVCRLYTNDKKTEKEYTKIIPFTIISKNGGKARNKCNKGSEKLLQ
jgi:hypothetical protein